MNSVRRLRPLAQWLWSKIPPEKQLAVDAKLFRQQHEFRVGDYNATLEVISGELRGRIEHRENLYPMMAEDGLMMSVPETIIQKLKTKDRASLHDLMICEGLPDLKIINFKEMEGIYWMEFERTQWSKKAA